MIPRIISRLDIKNEFVIKGIHLEGLRKVGDPITLAQKYYKEGIHEIILMDAVAAYYDRNSLDKIISKTCEKVFVPITVGGGIRSIENIQTLLKSGADKVAINTHALRNPSFIDETSRIFGSQCIVGSVVAKKKSESENEGYIDNGREPTRKDPIEWAKELVDRGAGEIMVTSIDNEGTKKGFDNYLCKKINEVVSVPVIASGGCGSSDNIKYLLDTTNVSGVAIASLLHYNIESIDQIHSKLADFYDS